jgi:poly-gamma-glutamate synthesis protein (capsule biosynthesis protein)
MNKTWKYLIFCFFIILFFIFFNYQKEILIKNESQNFNTLNISKNLDLKENLSNNQNNFKELKLFFIGDIMLARGVEQKILKNGNDFLFPFKKIINYLNSFDYVIGNLEGQITLNNKKIGGIYSFRMKPEAAWALAQANIKIVNLANNHMLDYDFRGFLDTLENLNNEHILYFGNSYEPLIVVKENTKIGFLGFTEFLKNFEVNEEKNKVGIAIIRDNLCQVIQNAKEKTDILIISFHWGEEYQKLANDFQRKIAKEAIDCGGDLIIGHHPHVIQDIEKYNGKYIFYSLGNFIFDQNFSKETMEGGGVEVIIKDKKIENIYFRKFYLNNDFQIEKLMTN